MSTPPPIPYVPPPSIGHEIGVMFGFGGAMVLSMVGYLVFWKSKSIVSLSLWTLPGELGDPIEGSLGRASASLGCLIQEPLLQVPFTQAIYGYPLLQTSSFQSS